MTLAIEPMINAGSWAVESLPDNWTIVTQDGRLAAHFEHTVAITRRGPDILTLPAPTEKAGREASRPAVGDEVPAVAAVGV